MAIYSIKDLEKLTGIKAHTIRIWEKRYKLLAPQRTANNIRYYLDKDLRRLLNIALLKNNGHKISAIAAMNETSISTTISNISKISLQKETQLDTLTIAMIDMDESKFNHILSTNIKEIGFEQTILTIIFPFLEKISLLWLTGSIHPIQESFTSYLIRQKIIVAIDELKQAPILSKKFIIYIPEEEIQELSILFLHFLIKSRGYQVIYLGQNVSIKDLAVTIDIHQPDYAIAMISKSIKNQSLTSYRYHLTSTYPKTHWLFTGLQFASTPIEKSSNSHILSGLQDILHFLSNIK